MRTIQLLLVIEMPIRLHNIPLLNLKSFLTLQKLFLFTGFGSHAFFPTLVLFNVCFKCLTGRL